jgi:hypothetical protein
MPRTPFILLSLLLALSAPAWSSPETYLVKDSVLDDARARAEAKAVAEYQAMKEARVKVSSRVPGAYLKAKKARAEAAKAVPKIPH